MRCLGLQGILRSKGMRTTVPAKDGKRAGDLLDRDFTACAASAPRGTLYELTGMVLPDGVTVEVHEETRTHLHPVVPAQASDGEIAEEDLELVAGGSACWDHCGCSVSFASPAGLRFGA